MGCNMQDTIPKDKFENNMMDNSLYELLYWRVILSMTRSLLHPLPEALE